MGGVLQPITRCGGGEAETDEVSIPLPTSTNNTTDRRSSLGMLRPHNIRYVHIQGDPHAPPELKRSGSSATMKFPLSLY